MGQIVKRKKKGRPPKADLGGREPPPPPERDLRRSLRRRNVKYVFDLDDYFDEDELFAEDEDQRRREKKLELLLKLQTGGESESTVAPQENRYRRVDHASVSSDDDEKSSKKRKIDGYINEDVDDENDEANEEDNYNYEDEEEVRVRKTDPKAEESPPGTPTEAPSGIPLPDKKALELILDKLQKKDIYGVYAEPVDPEELPDYHDIIEHPMDFATVRNKLGNGLYATFEQFESDVFLICSNAMQYNSPDTIYHKQARTIEELAKRKFQKIRLNVERTEKENKPEQKLMRSGSSSLKKQIKRSVSRTLQEPVGSDFSSGATLATTGDNQNFANAFQPVGSEKPDSIDGLVESNLFLNDNNLDKGEESLPGRGLLSRFGKKSFVPDENRRATYTISLSHPLAISDSIFSTFDGETKELVPVGLYSDHSYARSLARFAATLGSVAWKVASKRIEQALPQGFKFGQGWVGEYEPLPTPVLMLENCSIKEPPFLAKVQPRKLEKIPASSVTESPASVPSLEHKLPFLGTAGMRTPASASIITAQPIRGNSISETKQSFFLSPKAHPNGTHNLSHHHPSLQSRGFVEPDKKIQKNVELNAPPVNKNPADHIGNRQNSKSSENVNVSSSGSFQQSDSNGVAFRGLADGKIVGNKKMDGNTIVSSPNQGQGQGLSDPVQLMRQLSEKNALNQQKPSNRSSTEAPQVLPSFTTNDPNNAALAAARAWMSVGAGGFRPIVAENANKNQIYADSLYNSTRDAQSQVSRFRGEFHNSPVHAFVPQGPMPMMVGNEVQFQNQRMVFPQVATADLSRFGLQSSWQNISPQMQMRQKQESLPPDLNIGFQSSGSPGRPSSGVLVDSQQPDLALQL